MARTRKPSLSLRGAKNAKSTRPSGARSHANRVRSLPFPSLNIDWHKARIIGVSVIFALLWLLLWARTFQLQIIRGPRYTEEARRAQLATEVATGMRGSILDRNGNVLAKSVETTSVGIRPRAVKDVGMATTLLAGALQISPQKARALVTDKRPFVWAARKVSPRAAEALRAKPMPGIALVREFERVYPFKHMAGQLIGFVDIDDNGIEGLEKSLNEMLSGQRKQKVLQRDAAGRRLYSGKASDFENLSGDDVRLTIDTQVQFFAESALAEGVDKFGANWAGCLVVDVPTGDILAWAEYPFFNPNRPREFSPFVRRNKIAMDALEQGSTMKPFLMAAAIHEGVVNPSTQYNCENGQWKLHNVVIRDTSAHGVLDAKSIMRVSSNIGAAKIGLDLGAKKYHQYLSGLGFGERTGLPLAGESRGIFRPLRQWTEIDLAAASFGQGISVTALQMAQAFLSLGNDGVKKPLRLVTGEERAGVRPERVFSARAAKDVRDMLRAAVEDKNATGRRARIQGIEVGGKTGTAQKASGDAYGTGRVASFVGLVPAMEPRFLVLVVFDEPVNNQYGGVVTAPIFQNVALRAMAYNGLLPENTPLQVLTEPSDERSRTARVPQATRTGGGISQQGAAQTPSPVETPRRTGEDGLVAAPELADLTRRAGARGGVPSVVGLSVRKAVEQFAHKGLLPTLKGTGDIVVRQMPEPGSSMPGDPSSAECVLWVEERS